MVEKSVKRYSGPYKVTDKVSDVSYKIEIPFGPQFVPISHISKLRKAYCNVHVDASSKEYLITHIHDPIIFIYEPEKS